MRGTLGSLLALTLLLSAPSARAEHGGLEVELWTDRGNDAVYQPGDGMEVRVRSSVDGYLLVYEIDVEGYVRLLWPDAGHRGYIEGRRTLDVPSDRSNLELVVDDPAGQGYLVALVSREPFRDLPWYLRPYDMQAEASGYAGEEDDDEGVTRDGRIVGDPFVAMERVRRQVLEDPEDPEAFGSAYTSYYVHQRVRYPRYLCYDCHRPDYWAWWDGFDPYYANCSVFEFRVNRGWFWGPTYWFGYVPYYYYVPRTDCPPQYAVYTTRGTSFSGWDGWPRWRKLLGSSLRRYKSPPPEDYVAPSKYKERAGKPKPPGLLGVREVAPGRHGGSLRPVAAGRGTASRGERQRVERPRDVARGGLLRPADPGRGRGNREDSETGRGVRGISDRDRGAPGRGRGEAVERPRRSDTTERPRREEARESPRRESRREAPQRIERPVERVRHEERRESPRFEERRPERVTPREETRRERPDPPRAEAPREETRRERPDPPKAEAPREQRREEQPRPAEGKREHRDETRGGGRGRPGR